MSRQDRVRLPRAEVCAFLKSALCIFRCSAACRFQHVTEATVTRKGGWQLGVARRITLFFAGYAVGADRMPITQLLVEAGKGSHGTLTLTM